MRTRRRTSTRISTPASISSWLRSLNSSFLRQGGICQIQRRSWCEPLRVSRTCRSDRAGFSPSLNFARAIPLEASVDFEAHRAHQSVEHIKPYPKVGDLRMETAMATPAIGDSKCSQQRHACRRLRHERAVLRAIGASGAMSQSGNDFDTNTAGSLR